MLIGTREWIINGMLLHGLPESALQVVADRLAKIGRAPSHYFYPELFVLESMPADLASALANK